MRRSLSVGRVGPVAALSVAVALLAACSGEEEVATALVVADEDGVVVLRETGEVMRRVGSIAEGALAFQPTWSPDGSALVYTELARDGATLVITDLEGEEIRLPRETFPYYFSWDPTGDRFVTLRNATTEGGIVVESVAGDGATEEIDRGAPYYFDWDPAGGRYLVHVGNDRLALLEPGTAAADLDSASGSFQAPSWTEDGQVYLRRSATGQTLAIDTGDGPRDLAAVIGSAQLVAGQGRTAIQSFLDADVNGQQASRQALPEITPDALYVVDHDDGAVTEVVDHSVFSFFWSPDGERLLVLDLAETGVTRWRVWDGETIVDYPPFRPDDGWVSSFIPFFDQYATSMSLWSPDGSTFAYPGTHDDEQGVWLQRLDEPDPTRLAAGTWVAWQPGS